MSVRAALAIVGATLLSVAIDMPGDQYAMSIAAGVMLGISAAMKGKKP